MYKIIYVCSCVLLKTLRDAVTVALAVVAVMMGR